MKLKILNLVLCIILAGTVALGGILWQRNKSSEADIKVVQAPQQYKFFEPEKVADLVNFAQEDLGTNQALQKRANCDFFNQVYVAENVIDGDDKTYWEGAVDMYPNHLSVDLSAVTEVRAIRIRLNPNNIWESRTQNFSVLKGDDGVNYSEILKATDYDFNPDTGNSVIIEFDQPVKTRYLQLIFNSNTGANAGQVAEFEVY